jgi:hypothetical protein
MPLSCLPVRLTVPSPTRAPAGLGRMTADPRPPRSIGWNAGRCRSSTGPREFSGNRAHVVALRRIVIGGARGSKGTFPTGRPTVSVQNGPWSPKPSR